MKSFDEWNEVKKELSTEKKKTFFIKDREIYWVNLGKNVGYEQDGKGENFLRPVLIYRKFNSDIFYGIPLTTKAKENKFHFRFLARNRENYAILSQMKLIDTKRIHDKLGKMNSNDFEKLKIKLGELLNLTPTKNSGLPEQAGNLNSNYSKDNFKSKEAKND